MRLSRRFKYFFRIVTYTCLGLYVGMWLLLNTPSVQSKLASVVSKELKQVLHSDVSIGHVDIGLFNRIIIENVKLDDQQGEDMLEIARLAARFELMPLFEGRIIINNVQLFGLSARLSKETPEAIPNFQFVIDALASKDTLKKETNLDLRINSVLIRRGKIAYDVLSVPETPGKFNASHIGVDQLTATVSLKALKKDSLHAIVRRLSFVEQSGFGLNQLSFRTIANNNQLSLRDFKLELSNTALTMDSLEVRYDSLASLPKLMDDVTYQGKLAGNFYPTDLSPFVPVLKGLERPINLALAFKGKGKDVECPELLISDAGHLRLNAEALVYDWDAKLDMFVDGKITNFHVTSEGLHYYMTNLTGSLPPILKQLGYVRFQGEAGGYLSQMKVMSKIQTKAGQLDADLLVNSDKDFNRTYSGSLKSKDLNLGLLLNNVKKFGMADFEIEVSGFNYMDKTKYPESTIKGVIHRFDYSDYRYENITLDGLYKDGGFNGQLALDDVNGQVRIDGSFNVAKSVSDFNLKASVKKLRPYELHLSDKYVDSDISLDLLADFSGSSVDDVNGRVLLKDLILNAPNEQGYQLDSLKITAGMVKGKKELHVQSPFITALIRGDYSYKTVPSSILRTMQKYIPSLITLSDGMPKSQNNFQFDVKISNTDLLRKFFFIPIEVHMPATLSGYVNDQDSRLKLEGSFPRITYNGTLYESGTLLFDNPSDQLNCQARGSMLMKSGAMLTLSADIKAEQDRMKTLLNWGNNTDVTYGGRVSALTHFRKTEGRDSRLQADIEFLPSQIVLSDTVWNIRSSHVAIDSGRVFVDNFLVERPNQHLRIDGKISKEDNDSCLVDLKNIDVKYVLDIVRFDDVEFGGLATGKVHLKSILKNLSMQTRLHVHQFAVNKGLMGEADIKGVWDNELGGIRLDAQIAEEGLSSTHVTGYVSPKLKGLDLNIEADSTNIGLLDTYLEGIFSEMKGRVNGNVRLFGTFKTLDLEGRVRAMIDAKVDVLNTYFQVRNDSIHIRPGEFAFENVRVYDREGHTGQVNGYLRHNHLKNLTYNFDINSNNLLMYYSNDPGDLLFYGTVYGTGNVQLNGGNNAMNVNARVTTGPNTTFTYVTGLTAEATNNQFITFVDKTPKRVQDMVETDFYHFTDANKKQEEEGPEMDLRINMQIEATPDANMKVVMDPVAGDNITARGSGNFNVSFYNKGDFRMFGDYNIERGMYKLSMEEVIRKDFTLQSGSTITFTGDPYQANLDVKAVYTVNSASWSDLTPDATLSQSTVKVNCIMNMTGSLASPNISFDLELPMVSEEDRELVRSVTSTEEQMNTQIIYLLGIGKFYTYDYANNANQSSNTTSSLAFSTLSGQLNNMLSQVMDNKDWNIGANLSTGQQGWSTVEAEAMLSGRLLNNRLLINGNFGYRENVMANTNFVGDFEAIWLLTKNGDFRLRGYNQTNDRYFTKSTLTTQGIGFIYKKDFNRWNELFQWVFRKRREKKEATDPHPVQEPSPLPLSKVKREGR